MAIIKAKITHKDNDGAYLCDMYIDNQLWHNDVPFADTLSYALREMHPGDIYYDVNQYNSQSDSIGFIEALLLVAGTELFKAEQLGVAKALLNFTQTYANEIELVDFT